MPRYQGVFFDMDGTIVDTDRMIVLTFNELYDLYRNGNRTPEEKVIYFSGPPLKDTLQKEFPDMDQDFIYREFMRISPGYYASTVKAYPNVKSTILSLKEKGIKVALVTNKAHDPAIFCLGLVDMDGLFDAVIGYDDVKVPKPDGEGIRKAMLDFGIDDPSAILYIGDNTIDYVTANNAGVKCALVAYGPRTIENGIEPEFWLRDFKELIDYV